MELWSIEVGDPAFTRFLKKLSRSERTVVTGRIDEVLVRRGIDICESSWGKPLGGGLYEFRINQIPEGGGGRVLIRIFCTFAPMQRAVLLHGYNKLSDPSKRRQALEIRRARKALREWRARLD